MSKPYPTPHINASPDDFAKTVLMPGDPHRSHLVAKEFLSGAKLVNDVRGVQGYTGTYKGIPVSVMASGMGMPSMGIYSYELFNFFGVDNIIRIGSAGAYNKNIKVRDVVIAEGACTDSDYINGFGLSGNFSPIADYKLLSRAVNAAEKSGVKFHVGNVISSDCFYRENSDDFVKSWSKMGVMAVEMETAALYINAARAGKSAVSVCTVSDHLITGESTTAEERQNSFTDMIKIALETAVSAD